MPGKPLKASFEQKQKKHHWKTTSIEDDLDKRQPQWKTTIMEADLNGRRFQWKTTSMETTSMEDDLIGR